LKTSKLIRDIKEIADNPDLHFWIKCKKLTKIKTYNRPGSYEGSELIRGFFETCAGRFQNRFESAYVRPYLYGWRDSNAYDYVNKKRLNNNLACKIGRRPRGITDIAKEHNSQERFADYIRAKYPDAFEEFKEIKKVDHYSSSETRETSDCAWHHIFGDRVSNRLHFLTGYSYGCPRAIWQTPKETQIDRRKFDLAMEKAQKDYDELRNASGLPPRYLYNEVSLAELQNDHKNHTYAIFKGHYITTETVLHYDNSRVSFGIGSLAHTDRSIAIRCKSGPDITWKLSAYRGNFILNAIEERFGMVEKVKVGDSLKPVQLNPKMEVLEIAKSNGFRVFKRLFSGVHYDYCVLKKDTTYHGTTIDQCIKGWEKKKGLAKTGAKVINMQSARALGFCRTGIRQFCNTNKIDSNDDYTIEELRDIVKKNLSYNKSYYGRELKQVGIL
jgi:hypothetical protein